MSHRQFIGIGATAKEFGVHRDTIRRWEKLGLIKTIRNPMNRYRMFNKDEITALKLRMYQGV